MSNYTAKKRRGGGPEQPAHLVDFIIDGLSDGTAVYNKGVAVAHVDPAGFAQTIGGGNSTNVVQLEANSLFITFDGDFTVPQEVTYLATSPQYTGVISPDSIPTS